MSAEFFFIFYFFIFFELKILAELVTKDFSWRFRLRKRSRSSTRCTHAFKLSKSTDTVATTPAPALIDKNKQPNTQIWPTQKVM